MDRNEIKEKQFKKRYNRKVEVYDKIYVQDKKIKRADVKIVSEKGTEYSIIEFLKKGLTDYVFLLIGDKKYKYNEHLHAEVHTADLIGEEMEG